MKKIIFVFLAVTLSCSKEKTKKPPLAPSVMAIDEYHGQKIEDSYRNLENLEDSTVIHWLRKQGDFASGILEQIPHRQKLIDKQLSYDKQKEHSVVLFRTTSNGKYFFTKTTDDDQIAKLYYKKTLQEDEVLLYDPREFSPHKEFRINYIRPDWTGDQIVISLSKKGEEASDIIVFDVNKKEVLPGVITHCTPSIGGIEWLSDNSGFIYMHVPIIDPNDKEYWLNGKAVVYKIGSDPKKLLDVFSKESNPGISLNPEDFPLVYNQDKNDDYVFAVVGGSSSYYDVYMKKEVDLFSRNKPWEPLYKQSDMVKSFKKWDDKLVFMSSKNAPNFQICLTSIENPDFENPEVLVSEKSNELITYFVVTDDGIYYTTIKNGVEGKLYRLKDSVIKEIPLPKPAGNISVQSKGIDNKVIRVTTLGYLNPVTNYFYDLSNHTFELENFIPTGDYTDFKDFTVEHIEIPSHDGVLIPVSIIKNKNTLKNGKNPTLFYGYGAYGGTGGAFFNPSFLTWIVEGGVLVIAHVRGGGQKGDAWHKAGFKTTKPNTWKDMIAATEYIINDGYTSPEKTAIWGSSAGGIMAGRAITERPDLYKAALLWSPALNMLRCEIQPNGQNSIKEFGTVEIKEEFEALLEMDSYHHIQQGVKYPATLVTGGMKDGRVVIWDPAKFVAKLQANNGSDNPILFAVSFEDGHGGISNNNLERYKRYADSFSFLFWQLDHPDYQIKQ